MRGGVNNGSEYYGWSIHPIIRKRPETKLGSEDAQKPGTTEQLRYAVTMQTQTRGEKKVCKSFNSLQGRFTGNPQAAQLEE